MLPNFKYLNQSEFVVDFMSKSKSWLTHKIKGTDSKGGFAPHELTKIADGFDKLAEELKNRAIELRKQVEDKTLLINILTDE